MRFTVLAFFFVSGFCGLLYEVVWIRAAGTVIGNTTHAIGTVVAVYMGGLALGAWRGGRAADRRSGASLLALYGRLEAGVAASALAVPFLLGASEPLFRLLWNSTGGGTFYAAFRVILVALLLAAPTTLMGATLPVLARFLGEPGRAYAVNTFGGVAGTLAAGFWLIPSIGLRATTFTAVALNMAIAAASLAIARNGQGAVKPEISPEPPPARLALAAAAISGFTALVYEVAWTRSLVLTMGSTVYAFTLTLAAFILGLACGSAVAARLLRPPVAMLAALQVAVAVAALALLPFLGDLPIVFAPMVESLSGNLGRLLLAQFGLIALFVFIPATLLGAVFPLACRMAGGSDSGLGRSVGAVYTWNTIGCIAGTLAASFVLVPALGLSATIKIAATLNLLLAAFLLAKKPRLLAALPVVVAGVAWLVLPAWNPKVLSSGAFLYGDAYARGARDLNVGLRSYVEEDTELVAQHWDSYGLVTVHRQRDGVLSMRVNGKVDASTGPADRATMHAVGHVPLLHHPAPKRALLIGLGAGFTLAAMERHPLETIECVEISRAVVRASGHFRDAAGDVLADARVRLVIDDGRNAVFFGRGTYDVIVSQPSNLWISGMANLFTREFFEKSSQRLAPGGIFCQWVHAYRLSTDNFREVLRTFFSVFPHGSVWEVFPGSDYFLLGSLEPLAPRLDPDILDLFVTDADGARAAAGPGAVSTDDRCAIEYTAPRALYRDSRPETLDWLDRVRVQSGARRVVARAVKRYAEGHPREALAHLEEARVSFGRDPRTQVFVDVVAQDVIKQALRGDPVRALEGLEAVPPSSRHYAEARIEMGEIHLASRDVERARTCYVEARTADPRSHDAEAGIARVFMAQRRYAEAAEAWQRSITLKGDFAPAHVERAVCLWKTGKIEEARRACRRALELDPADSRARALLADLMNP